MSDSGSSGPSFDDSSLSGPNISGPNIVGTGAGPRGQPLRVLHLLPRLSRGGGVQIVVRRLAEAADPAQIELHVATVRPELAIDGVLDLPVTLHPLGFEGDRYRPFDRVRLSNRVERIIQKINPDVVQVHSGFAWLGLSASIRRPKLPFVFEIHDAPGSGRHGRLTDAVEGIWSRVRRPAVVCHSASVERALVQRWRLPPSRIIRFPLAVDTTVFTPAPDAGDAERVALGIEPDAFVMIAVGRLVPSKRFDRAIAAAGRLSGHRRPVHLLIVGDGPERDRLQGEADACTTADVRLLGPKFGPDLATLLNASDVLVSTSEYEGFGLTLIEAMATGVAVVAVNAGGVADIVHDKATGYLVDPGNSEEFDSRLCSLRDDAQLLAGLGFNALSRARRLYSAPKMAEEFATVYRRVVPRAPE